MSLHKSELCKYDNTISELLNLNTKEYGVSVTHVVPPGDGQYLGILFLNLLSFSTIYVTSMST